MDTIEKKISLKKRILAFVASVAVLGGGVVAGVQAADDPATTGKVQVTVFDDETDAPLAGAKLQIVDGSGSVVVDFESSGQTQEFTLPVGNYKLHQVSAPEGYIGVSEDAAFEVKFTEKLTTTTLQEAAPLPTGVVTGYETNYPPYVVSNGSISAAVFCVDSSYDPVGRTSAKYTAQPLTGFGGASAEQLLRILYVGWGGNAKGYASQIHGAKLTAEQQFGIATQYAITYYTDGARVADSKLNQFSGWVDPNLFSIAYAIRDAANDTSIVIPEGYNAYLYTSNGGQPAVAASFPVVQQHIEQNQATQVRIGNHKTDTPPPPPASEDGKVVIKKVDDKGNVLKGAKFKIVNASGQTVKEFTSTGNDEFTLSPGAYTLIETAPPAGYEIEGDGKYEFTIKPGTAGVVSPGQTTNVVGTTTAGGIITSTGSMEIDGSALAFCVNPQAIFLWEKPGSYSYSVVAESSVDLNAFGSKNPAGARGWVNAAPANVGLTAEKMEQVKKVLWATYDYMLTGDASKDYTGIISDNLGTTSDDKFKKGSVYWATEAAIAEIVSPGSVNWNRVNDNLSEGNVETLARALIAAAQGQASYASYFAAYGGYSIVYLQSSDPSTQNLITPGSEVVEVTVVNKPKEDTPDGEITIEKYDDSGNHLKGAHLQIIDSEGKVVEDFVSDGSSMKFRLPVGEYVLHEVSAPAGYTLAPDQTFTVIDDSKKSISEETFSAPEDLPGPTVSNNSSWFTDSQGRSVIGYCIDSYVYFNNNAKASYTAYPFTEENVIEFAGGFNGLQGDGHVVGIGNSTLRYKPSDAASVYRGILRVLYMGAEGQHLESDIDWVDKWRATQYVLTYMADEHYSATVDPWGGKTWSRWVKESSNPAGLEAYAQGLMNAWSDSSLDAEINEVGYKAVIYYGGWQPNVSAHFGTKKTTVKEWQETNGTVSMIDFRETTIGTVASNADIEGFKIANAGDPAQGPVTVKIRDVVSYTNAYVGRDHVLKGQLVLKSTGEVLDTSYTTFKPVAADSVAFVNFEFKADAALQEKLRNGDAVVAFEELFTPGESLYKGEVATENLMTGEEIEASGKADELMKDAQWVAEHKDINDGGQTVTFPVIGTTATDKADGDHSVPAGKVTIVDEVKYSGLIAGKQYTVSGTLHDQATGEALTVEGATATKTFTADKADGSVKLEFTIDTSALIGKALVAFEEVKYEGKTVAVHADINDENQTVVVKDNPEIGTTATDGTTGDHIGLAAEKTVLRDVVAYSGLKPGETYTVKGQLMKRADSSVIEGATAEATFVASDSGEGTVELTFTYDARPLAGFASVAFEEVYDVNGTLIAEHKDIKDEGQTVYYPEAKTNATDKADGDHFISAEKVTVVDKVTYKNLIPGKEYTVSGVLMDKETNEPLLVDGKQVTATKTFKASAKTGSVDLEFTFDASALKGKTIVAFETVKYESKTVAVHADINDEDQTVYVPEIGTKATADGYKQAKADGTVTIKDVVKYEGLKPNTEYTMSGKLVTKSSGGKTVVAENSTTFTSSESGKGEVELEFTVDASKLAGESVVAFETVSYEGKEVAVHADINDADQTVTFPEVKTNASDKADGDQVIAPEKTVTVVDKVTYKNLLIGRTYTVSGVLMDKATGEPLEIDGKQVTAEKTFKADKANGSIELEFTFNASALEGKTLVVFESLKHQDREVAVHADINDEDQTVKITEKPEIGTTATSADGGKEIELAKNQTIVDTVTYTNLDTTKTYRVSGVLMDKETGKPALMNGKQVTAVSEDFKPAKTNGTVEVTFVVDGRQFGGKNLVVFEKLYVVKDGVVGNTPVATHEDINDKGQTVHVKEKPEIEKYVNQNVHKDIDLDEVFTYDVLAYITKDADKAVITDTLVDDLQFVSAAEDVTVVDLGTENNHKPYGTVAEDGTPVADTAITIDGQTLTVTIDPATAERGHWVKVTFDAKIKDGLTIDDLKYATVEKNDPVLTDEKHEGVPNDASYKVYVGNEGKYEDESNTVTVKPKEPSIKTSAKDGADGDKELEPTDTAVVVDTVTYSKLAVGKEYTVSGVLMDKETGEALLVNGEKVTASTTFIPEAENGTVDVTFEFDASALRGKTLVVFEKLVKDGKEIAVHEDINDVAQTVKVKEKPEIEKYVNKNVHKDIDLNEVFTYDVLAYITKDADKAVITDTLNDDLQFVSAASDVTVVDLGEDNDHTPVTGTVSKDGTPVKSAKAVIDGQTLAVTIDPATAERGHWVKVTFDAKIADGKNVEDLKYATVEKNDPVLTDEKHEGVPNDASYKIYVGNEGKYEDESNTVTVKPKNPEVGTTATVDGEHVVLLQKGSPEDYTIVDTVAWRGLAAGKYVVRGTLMNGENGEVIEIGDAPLTASAEFEVTKAQAAKGEGTVDVEFNVNVTDLFAAAHINVANDAQATVNTVVFEQVFAVKGDVVEDTPLASHEDINDEGQTVVFSRQPYDSPEMKLQTTATDNNDGDKTLEVGSDATVKDVVAYSGLQPGMLYTLKGKLVVKGTNGQTVVAEAEDSFTPEAEDGTVEMLFNFNTTGLDGKDLVVYEYLYSGDFVGKDTTLVEYLVKHADDNDADQTVTVKKENKTPPPTPPVKRTKVKLPVTGLPQTGETVALAIGMAALLVGGGVVLLRRRND